MIGTGWPGRVVTDEHDAAAVGRVIRRNVIDWRGRDSNEIACVREVEGVDAVTFRMLVIEHLAGESCAIGRPHVAAEDRVGIEPRERVRQRGVYRPISVVNGGVTRFGDLAPVGRPARELATARMQQMLVGTVRVDYVGL